MAAEAREVVGNLKVLSRYHMAATQEESLLANLASAQHISKVGLSRLPRCEWRRAGALRVTVLKARACMFKLTRKHSRQTGTVTFATKRVVDSERCLGAVIGLSKPSSLDPRRAGEPPGMAE